MILYRSSVKEKVLFMVFNATYNNISAISWWSVLLVGETGVHGKETRTKLEKKYNVSPFDFYKSSEQNS
jgi:hypothetical protein